MKGFIELSTRYGGPRYINPEFIATIEPIQSGTRVFIGSGDRFLLVTESPETILSKIQSLNQ